MQGFHPVDRQDDICLTSGKPFSKGSLRSVFVARRCLLRAVGAFALDVHLGRVRVIVYLV